MKLNCVLLAPDSFKGTLSAQEVCDIEAQVIRKRFPEAEILTLPMADGGEGMTESYLRRGCRWWKDGKRRFWRPLTAWER